MIKIFLIVLLKDLKYYHRKKGEWLLPLLFCLIVCSLFSMVFPYSSDRLVEIAPTILWVTLILSILLSIENILQADFKNGSLEQLILSPYPLSILMLAKVTAHWLAIGLPLTLLLPLFTIPFQLPWEGIIGFLSSIALGVPILSLVGMLCATLTLGLHKGGIFLALLILPLLTPVLILGTSASYAASLGLPFTGHMALLLAILIFALCFVPLGIAAALKIGVQ